MGVVGILATVALVVTGQLLLKRGMSRVGAIDRARLRQPLVLVKTVVRTPAVVGGLAVYSISAVGWILVLSRFDLSFAYPFLAISYVGVTAAAVRVLGEKFSLRQWAGMAVVAIGVVLVASSGV